MFGQKFKIKEDPNHPVPKEAYGWRIYIITLCASLGPAMTGYDTAYIGGVLQLQSFREAFGIEPYNVTALSSNIVSTLIAGAVLGSIGAYFIAENWGRRNTILAAAVFAMIGGIMQLFPSIGLLYAGRAVAGIGIGGQAGITSVYLTEIAPSTIRGRIVGIKDTIMMVAQVCGYWVNYGVKINIPPTSTRWRIPVGVQLVIPGIMLMTLPFMVESPRWLAQKKRDHKAVKALSWARNLPTDHEYVQWELREIHSQIAEQRSHKALFKELFAAGMRGRIFRSAGSKIMNPMTGFTALALYAPLIFDRLGFREQTLLLTGIYGVVKVFCSLIILLLCIDNLGRRGVVLSGSAVIILCHFYLGAYSQISGSFEHRVAKNAGAYVALFATYAFAAAWSWSWALFPCIFSTEIFPTHLRALAMTVTNISSCLTIFAVAYGIPYMLKNIKFGTFYLFGTSTLVSATLIWFFYPETKAFPLEDMDLLFTSVWARKARKEGLRLLEEKQKVERAESGSSESLEARENVEVPKREV